MFIDLARRGLLIAYGASWHPSLLQQQRMADELTPFLRKLMSWTD